MKRICDEKKWRIYRSLSQISDRLVYDSLLPADRGAGGMSDSPHDPDDMYQKPRFHFWSSGWAAALISVAVATGVLVAIVMAGRRPPVPDPVPPADLTTDTETETETEVEETETTTPESDFEIRRVNGKYVLRYIGTSDVIVMPETIGGRVVTEIDSETFSNVRDTLRSITLPETLQNIYSNTFWEFSALEEVHLPDSLTYLGPAFRDCTSLKHIRIPGHCVNAHTWACFWGCSSLESVELCEGIEYLPKLMFGGTHLKEVVFPSTMRRVDYSVFESCTNLERVVLNEGLEVIGECAFARTAIYELVIPKSVKEIYDSSFSSSKVLTKVRFEGDAPLIHTTDATIFPDNDCIIYYHEGAKGFTSPKWGGYQTEKW